MGTEPARLQDQLEPALGPVWASSARPGSRQDFSTRVVHTPTYTVPEQVTGNPAMDYCADLSALGVMADELLVGRIRSLPICARDRNCRRVRICNRARPLRYTPRQVKRTLAPRNSGRSAREVVFPPPTGGRFK